MEVDGRWRSLPSGPSLKHLTDPSYAIPPEQQKAALQDLTRAHVDSFNYAVLEGLSHAVQVSGATPAPEPPEWGPEGPRGWRRWPGGRSMASSSDAHSLCTTLVVRKEKRFVATCSGVV